MSDEQEQGVTASPPLCGPTGGAAKASPAKPAAANAGFSMKAWDVSVVGMVIERIIAPTRGAALAQAWRCDAFGSITFGQFLKIASAWRAMIVHEEFGAPISVEGEPAFYIGRNRAHVQIAYPGGKGVLSAHPYDVLPECYRPEAYRTAQADTHPKGGDGEAAPFMSGTVGPEGDDAPVTPGGQHE